MVSFAELAVNLGSLFIEVPALIPYVCSLSCHPIKTALIQTGTQLLQVSLLPSVPQPIGYCLVTLT